MAAADPYLLAKVVRDTPEIWREVGQMILYPTSSISATAGAGRNGDSLLYNRRYKGEKALIFKEYEIFY